MFFSNFCHLVLTINFLGCRDYNFMCSTEIDCTQGFFLTNCLKSCGICEVTEVRMTPEPICIPVPQVITAPPDNPIQA